MFGFSTLSTLFENVIKTKLVKNVYHSVQLRPLINGKGKAPAAKLDSQEWKYVGIDDTKGFSCYCRKIGAAEITKREMIGGCSSQILHTIAPHSLVFFNDVEKRSHDDITAKIIKAIMLTPNVRLQRIHDDFETIRGRECPTGKFNFTTYAYYTAFDFNLFLKLQVNNCEEEITCEGVKNPFCI